MREGPNTLHCILSTELTGGQGSNPRPVFWTAQRSFELPPYPPPYTRTISPSRWQKPLAYITPY